MKKVAVTGIPSSGKSSVCNFFDKLGAHVESADAIVHEMLTTGHRVGQKVIALMGSDVVEGNELNRSKIASRVFVDPDLLKALEHLLHPEVRDEIEKRYLKVKKQRKFPLFIAEIPLLFEAGMQHNFDAVIAVVADVNRCRERFAAQEGRSAEEFDRRLARQWSQEKKAKHANYVVTNKGKKSELEDSVKALLMELTLDKPSTQESIPSHESEK